MNIQCRTTTIFKIYYIYTGFSKMHVDSWWDSYLEHGGTPKTSVYIYIYIQRCTYDSNIRFGKFLLYEYIVPDNYNIQNILYIHRIFQNARRQLVGFLLRTWRNPQNLCVYIYIQRCTYDSNIRFGKFLLYEYIVPDNYNIQNILYIHRIFQNARRQLVGFLLRTWRNPQNLCVYIYSDVHTIRTSGLESFYYMNIQCRTTTIFKIYYIYTGFSKMHVDSWWDSYLEHGGTPKTSVYIYIYSDVHTIRTSGLESFYYMNIQCRTTTIFKIYYIYTGFSKMHVDSWWDSYLEHGGTPKTSVYIYIYIYSDVHTIRTSGLESFYYMNIQCRTTTIFKIYYIYTGFSKMHVDSWWDSYLENMEEPPKPLCIYIYIYIQRCTYDSNIRFGKFLLYEYIVPDNYNIQNILYIHRIFQNARRQLVGFLLRTWRNPQNLCVYIYIQRCTYDSNIRFGKFLLYEYIVPDNYNIQNILYIHRIFQNARRQLVGFLLRTWRNPQNLCVYICIYSDVHTIRTSGLESFYYMNIQCRTTTIFKIYYIYTGFSKMHVDSWWDSYLEHGGTPKTSVYIYIYSDVHTIRTSGLESFYYMNIQCRTTTIFKIYYIYTGFSKMHVDSWWDSYLEHGGTPKTSVYIYIYIAMYIRFEHQVWKVFII